MRLPAFARRGRDVTMRSTGGSSSLWSWADMTSWDGDGWGRGPGAGEARRQALGPSEACQGLSRQACKQQRVELLYG
jgi:hypothetical protein